MKPNQVQINPFRIVGTVPSLDQGKLGNIWGCWQIDHHDTFTVLPGTT